MKIYELTKTVYENENAGKTFEDLTVIEQSQYVNAVVNLLKKKALEYKDNKLTLGDLADKEIV